MFDDKDIYNNSCLNMSALRSQDMSLFQVMIARDNCWDIMNDSKAKVFTVLY